MSSYRWEIISLISFGVYFPWIFDKDVSFLRTDFDIGISKGLLMFNICSYARHWLVGIKSNKNIMKIKIFKGLLTVYIIAYFYCNMESLLHHHVFPCACMLFSSRNRNARRQPDHNNISCLTMQHYMWGQTILSTISKLQSMILLRKNSSEKVA